MRRIDYIIESITPPLNKNVLWLTPDGELKIVNESKKEWETISGEKSEETKIDAVINLNWHYITALNCFRAGAWYDPDTETFSEFYIEAFTYFDIANPAVEYGILTKPFKVKCIINNEIVCQSEFINKESFLDKGIGCSAITALRFEDSDGFHVDSKEKVNMTIILENCKITTDEQDYPIGNYQINIS